ncbi:ligand-binding sensor domain-containing protein [Moheibacter lacus]|uniref:Histidine kinase domain-containing protein n=1 Tax=Moheibacter lacus TaxID=2745851 RepID=A0A838ZQR4_9FLAO|nr:two-component regulator propeller domain-containing protein [Moheibacter lacus]MBA5629655.1 hypothetical protein [Moheibacter lacus]
MKISIQKRLLVALGLFISIQIHSQETLTVKVMAQQDGLSQLGVSSMDFDQKGYLWAGTQNGLNRYNGNVFKVFFSGNKPNDLKDDHIRSLLFLNDTLWIATNTNSVNAYLPKENRFLNFERYKNPNEFIKFTYALTASKENIIAGAVGHIFTINRKSKTIKTLKVPDILINDFVTTLAPIHQNQYLIGTNISGVYRYDEKASKVFTDEAFHSLKNHQINSILQVNPHRILIGTNLGLYQYIIAEEKLIKLHDIYVKSLYKWNENQVFVGGLNHNYFLSNFRDLEEIHFKDFSNQEIEAVILSIKKDSLGGTFFGTETKGILYYHPLHKKFSPLRINVKNSPKKDFISIFNFLRKDDNLWMATELGFAKYNLKTKTYQLYRTDNLEYTIAQDHQGRIWAGGFEEGLVRYDERKDQFIKIPTTFKDKDVIQLTFISEEKLWIHTWSNGIFEMDLNSGKTQPVFIDGKNLIRSRTSYIDRKGGIWIGSDEGLYHLVGKNVKYYGNLSNPRVFAISEDSKGKIWVGTAKGISKIDPEKNTVTKWFRQNGLPNDFIYGLLVDDVDQVWVSTNFGLSVYDPNTNQFKNYTEEDGLQNNEFNGKAAYKDESGNFYFGGMNGFNIIRPEKVQVNKKIGSTHVEDIKLFGKSINQNILYSDTLYFSHNENVITFDFISLNFLRSEKNRYRFILEGFDDQWRPETKEKSTTYTNLNPGTYIFKVMGSNNELLWGKTDQKVIIINSPWYQTTWFKILALMSIISLIGLIFYVKNLQQKRTNRRLVKMVENRTEELNQSNAALNESLATSKKQQENISFLMQELNHRVKNNLQLITSLIDLQSFDIENKEIQEKLKLLQSRVYTVAKVHDLLNKEDNEKIQTSEFIEELIREILLFSGQKIETKFELPPFDFPTKRITYLGLIFNELVTNSIKHAFQHKNTDKKIRISGYQNESELVLIYHDNGIGFQPETKDLHSSKGLNLIFTLVKQLNGEVKIENKEGSLVKIIISKKE